ncbi:ferredoxin [Streptomyces acidiscabies]|uniref:Ferredoxin n=1 Tax=Streptomyces acidiscabies TaxID=42234 RepID=A0AAP6EEW5_9ACTN|nr:ferredoxin [Streptomyces acidiscabies]MBP5936042.1 ferredoxin [Streptomyces sp. LBUM 1476]MBZ3916031.1 ferredoxin [Streptomyces acidiscabies]MDX2960422.1 ferredoxin [Streptomyces acidiscabies]MDX3017708.1 ferredoxin [Streptomyces acidiscabies]MDX3794363.1 ferredoxin [Streptomyces acidiscabies]
MRITADRERCVGAAQCVLAAPGVFDQDEEGLVAPLTVEPGEGDRRVVRLAVGLCPASAIRIDEG